MTADWIFLQWKINHRSIHSRRSQRFFEMRAKLAAIMIIVIVTLPHFLLGSSRRHTLDPLVLVPHNSSSARNGLPASTTSRRKSLPPPLPVHLGKIVLSGNLDCVGSFFVVEKKEIFPADGRWRLELDYTASKIVPISAAFITTLSAIPTQSL